MVELLSPAGNAECFYAAINNGADAIYIGLDEFSARKNAENFTLDSLDEYLRYARLFGVKVYVAVNTLIKDEEISRYFDVVKRAYLLGVDAFIIQDIAFGNMLKQNFGDIELHLSTQAGINNVYGAKFAIENNFKRVVLARETKIDEIKEIAKMCDTEVFVHGAMCTSFSGQCYMSSFVGGNSGNRGRCKQPCRQKYAYSGEGFSCGQAYSLSLSDLKLKDKIKDLTEAGVKSFKIEGRMRSVEYVATATRAYRKIIDGLPAEKEFDDLTKIYNRGNYTSGYTFGLDKNIISDKVQNHLGKCVCDIDKFNKTEIFTKPFNVGDAFKIIRDGIEVGSATCLNFNGKITTVYKGDIKKGDKLYITKDVKTVERALSYKRLKPLEVHCDIAEGKPITLESDGIKIQSDFIVQKAEKCATTIDEIKNNLLKTDKYPFDIKVNINISGNVFVLKSALNKARSMLYLQVYNELTKNKKHCKINDNIANYETFYKNAESKSDNGVSIIASDFGFLKNYSENIKDLIFFPFSYKSEEEFLKFYKDSKNIVAKKFLYLPAYFCDEDEEIVKDKFKYFDGVYCDGNYAINLCKKHNLLLYAGTGFNLFNKVDCDFISEKCYKYAYSKELSYSEIKQIDRRGAMFSLGNITLMDLIYCPFKRKCTDCKRGDVYTLKDEDGRVFIVRRYKLSTCRFKVYNCNDLVYASGNDNQSRLIYNFVLYDENKILQILNAVNNTEKLKNIIKNYTGGNLTRGIK